MCRRLRLTLRFVPVSIQAVSYALAMVVIRPVCVGISLRVFRIHPAYAFALTSVLARTPIPH
jgi:hypothetical protein